VNYCTIINEQNDIKKRKETCSTLSLLHFVTEKEGGKKEKDTMV